MKIKFNSDDNLPFNKMLKLHNMTTAFTSVFQEDGKILSTNFFRWMSILILEYDRIDIS